MNEFANAVLFGFGGRYDFVSEILVCETKGAAEGVADQGFGEASGKVRLALGNMVAQFEIVSEGWAVVKGARGIDLPTLGRPPVSSRLDAMSFGCAPFARGVEVLQPEANRIDLAVATGALSFLLMGAESVAGAERLVG